MVLNEAYRTLMDSHRRAGYDLQWQEAELAGYVGFTGRPMSAWEGPERVQGIFVDENVCIGEKEVTCIVISSLLPKTHGLVWFV